MNGKEVGKTKVIKKTLNPEWNETLQVKLKLHDRVELKVYDYDRFAFNDFMGTSSFVVEDNISISHQINLPLLDNSF